MRGKVALSHCRMENWIGAYLNTRSAQTEAPNTNVRMILISSILG